MENEWKWDQATLMSELKQGKELADQLNLNLPLLSANMSQELLLQRILCSYDKALLMLQCQRKEESQTEGDDVDKFEAKVVCKKRKVSGWTYSVIVGSVNGFEGPCEDEYSWRKYGQKDILGANYPRSYYRCTYRNVQNCWATKQVQRSDEDPTLFEITYKGKHTCTKKNPPIQSSSSSSSSPKQINNKQPNKKILLNARKNMKINTNNKNNSNNNNDMNDIVDMIPTHFNSTSFDPVSFYDPPKFMSNLNYYYYLLDNSWEGDNGFGSVNELGDFWV